MATCSAVLQANAQLRWFGSKFVDYGHNPSVAICRGSVIEVHQADTGPGLLWYRLGKLDNSNTSVSWGGSMLYDAGLNPSVAMSGAVVVEVHQADEGVSGLWYRVGVNDGTAIQWGPSEQYDEGTNPSVAVVNSTVIEVHQGQEGVGTLWYRVGQINGNSIAWSQSIAYDIGVHPAVAASTTNNGIKVIEVHQAADTVATLWNRTGEVRAGYVHWLSNRKYDRGHQPTIAAASDSSVESHQALTSSGPLWFRDGSASAVHYDNGMNPSLATADVWMGKVFVEVHEGDGAIWSRIALLQIPR